MSATGALCPHHFGEADAARLGKIRFDERYVGNPLVFCGCVGLIPRGRVEKAARPGDLVVADECGVCFVPYQRAAEVLKVAQQMAVSEKKRLDRLATGITVAEFSAIPRKS